MANGNGVVHNNDKEVQITTTTGLMVYVLGTFGVIVAFSWMIIWAVLKYTEV